MAKQSNTKKKVLIGTLSGVAALGIVAGVTIPLVMCSQKNISEVLVTFDADGQTGVDISVKQIKVAEGTTFGEVRSQVVATKATDNKQYKDMLGVREYRKPISGEFAQIIRESLRRTFSGELTEQEKEWRKREEEASKMYETVWK